MEQEQETTPTPSSERIKFTTLEHTHREKTKEWHIVLGIIFISLVVGAVILGNLLLAVFFGLAGVTLAISGNRVPREQEITIGFRGIRVDDVFYPYENLHSFWVEEEYGPRRLLLKSTKYLMPYVVILLPEDIDTEVLTEYLLQHILGEELHEPFLQQLMERFGL